MARDALGVAVVGATSLVGEEIIRILGDRQFPVSEVRALGSIRTAGRTLDEGTVALLGPDAFSGIDVAFFAAGPTVAGEWARQATEAGAIVVDTSSRFRRDPAVPLVVPEVNAALVSGEGAPTLVASPSSTAIGLSVALAPLAEAAGLRRAIVSTYQSAAGAGRHTVERLSKESIELLSGRGDDDPATVRRAFNCVPQIGTVEQDGITSHERAIADEIRRVLDAPALPIQLTAVRAPMFFGTGASVTVELERPLGRERAAAALRAARGLYVHQDGEPAGLNTPADVVGSQATHVGRLRDDPTVPSGLAFWLALDSIEKGGALNAVQIAEILIRRFA
jgi:aspartate-semialdehyde dehydrogenase